MAPRQPELHTCGHCQQRGGQIEDPMAQASMCFVPSAATLNTLCIGCWPKAHKAYQMECCCDDMPRRLDAQPCISSGPSTAVPPAQLFRLASRIMVLTWHHHTVVRQGRQRMPGVPAAPRIHSTTTLPLSASPHASRQCPPPAQACCRAGALPRGDAAPLCAPRRAAHANVCVVTLIRRLPPITPATEIASMQVAS